MTCPPNILAYRETWLQWPAILEETGAEAIASTSEASADFGEGDTPKPRTFNRSSLTRSYVGPKLSGASLRKHPSVARPQLGSLKSAKPENPK